MYVVNHCMIIQHYISLFSSCQITLECSQISMIVNGTAVDLLVHASSGVSEFLLASFHDCKQHCCGCSCTRLLMCVVVPGYICESEL